MRIAIILLVPLLVGCCGSRRTPPPPPLREPNVVVLDQSETTAETETRRETRVEVYKKERRPLFIWIPRGNSPSIVALLRDSGYGVTCNKRFSDLGLQVKVKQQRVAAGFYEAGASMRIFQSYAVFLDRRGRIIAEGHGTYALPGGVRIYNQRILAGTPGPDKACQKAVENLIADHKSGLR